MTSIQIALIASIAISILSQSASADPPIDQITTEICAQTYYPTFCSSVFRQYLPQFPKSVIGVNLIALNIGLANLTDTMTYIKDRLTKTTDQKDIRTLQICMQGYNPVEYNLKKCFQAFNGGDYSVIKVVGDILVQEQSSCYLAYEPYSQDPLHEMSREVMELMFMITLAASYLPGSG